MNTSKQINAMILLLAILLVGVGAYTIWDPFRAQAEEKRTKEQIALRAAHTYARNCRACHGNQGEGRIGPALAPAARKASGLPDFTDPAKLKENEALVKNTIICGRIGKVMPPWAIDQGGSLNDEQIRQLVILITENPGGDAWTKVGDISALENQVAPLPSVQDVLAGASITGANAQVCGQRVSASPTATPTPPPVSSTITLTATDNKFDKTALTVPANQQVTLDFENKGAAVHNFHVLQVKDTAGKDVDTTLIPGGQSKTITFTLDKAGSYAYRCDVHPTEMQGTLFVQ